MGLVEVSPRQRLRVNYKTLDLFVEKRQLNNTLLSGLVEYAQISPQIAQYYPKFHDKYANNTQFHNKLLNNIPIIRNQ